MKCSSCKKSMEILFNQFHCYNDRCGVQGSTDITFDQEKKIIFIPIGISTISIKELGEVIKDYEDGEGFPLQLCVLHSSSQTIRRGLQIINSWKIKIEDRPGPGMERFIFYGGNLVCSTKPWWPGPVLESDNVMIELAI